MENSPSNIQVINLEEQTNYGLNIRNSSQNNEKKRQKEKWISREFRNAIQGHNLGKRQKCIPALNDFIK